MGAMSFEFSSANLEIDRLAATIQIHGIDKAPFPGRVQRSDNVLTIVRQPSESGQMSVSWPTDRGWMRIMTGSLPEKESPYRGELELARGLMNDLRNHIAIWMEAGLTVPQSINEKILRSTELFVDSELATDSGQAAESAVRSINGTMSCVFELTHSFANQVAHFQRRSNRFLDFSFGVSTMESHDIPQSSGKMQWLEYRPLTISGKSVSEYSSLTGSFSKRIFGPIVDVSLESISKFELIDESFEHKRQVMLSEFTDLGQNSFNFDICHAIGGIDGIGHRQMSFPHQLQMAIDAIQQAQTVTSKPILASFCNPFGDQVARSLGGSIAIQIADELLRRGAQISYLGLEINLDFLPYGDVATHPFAWLDMLDQWGYFGIPLVIFLRMPLNEGPTTIGNENNWRREPIWRSMSKQQRLEYLNVVLPLLGTRIGIQSVIWNNRFTDIESRFHAAHWEHESHSKSQDGDVFTEAIESFCATFPLNENLRRRSDQSG